MEIERKFLIARMPDLEAYPCKQITQGYLCTSPVVRVRRSDDRYSLTYKGVGLLAREEHDLPLSAEGYAHLVQKIDGILIEKTRYLIPLPGGLTAELDVFHGAHEGLTIVEVEFDTIDAANAFLPPEWFGEDVTEDEHYQNSNLSH